MAKILIADDDDGIRELLKVFLTSKGHRVISASNGIEAFEKVKQLPELIISDLSMPHLGGLELAAKVKKSPRFSMIPFILTSAGASLEDRTRAIELTDGLINKPFNWRELTHAIELLLSP